MICNQFKCKELNFLNIGFKVYTASPDAITIETHNNIYRWVGVSIITEPTRKPRYPSKLWVHQAGFKWVSSVTGERNQLDMGYDGRNRFKKLEWAVPEPTR